MNDYTDIDTLPLKYDDGGDDTWRWFCYDQDEFYGPVFDSFEEAIAIRYLYMPDPRLLCVRPERFERLRLAVHELFQEKDRAFAISNLERLSGKCLYVLKRESAG